MTKPRSQTFRGQHLFHKAAGESQSTLLLWFGLESVCAVRIYGSERFKAFTFHFENSSSATSDKNDYMASIAVV